MEKLNKRDLYYLTMSLLIYILALQYRIDDIFISNFQMIQQGNMFNDVNLFMFILKSIILMISILFLFLQSFIYRIILLLLKTDRYPSMLKNFLFILYSLIPYSIVIILIENFNFKINFDSPFLLVFKIITSMFVYAVILYYKKLIGKNKVFLLLLFLSIIEFFSNGNYIIDIFK